MINVGMSADFTLTGPWAGDSGNFTVESVTSGAVLTSFGVNVHNDLFVTKGLSQTDYDTWFGGSGLIYTLTDNLRSIRVPDTYVTVPVAVGDVAFKQRYISIELGYLTEAEAADVAAMSLVLKDVVTAEMGIDATLKTRAYGTVKHESAASAATIATTRSDRVTTINGTRPTREFLVNKVATLTTINGLFSDIITDNINNP